VTRLEHETYGSLFTSYRRESRITDLEGATLSDSSLFTDAFLDSRVEGERFGARGQLAGSYRYDFLEGASGDEIRISSLFVEASDRVSQRTASAGRRSQSTGGVLGRYDGGRLAQRFGDRWETALVGGFPVESPTSTGIDTDRYFAGLSLEGEGFFDLLDAQAFGIFQMADDLIDRAAVGGELRYFDAARSAFAFLDFDVHYLSVNTAQLVGSQSLTDDVSLNFLVDYRNAPLLTTSNALLGQPVASLSTLEASSSRGEIESLAEDRTADALTLSAGASWVLNDRLQLGGDFTTARLSGTPASGGVAATEGTGFEFSYFGQLIASDVLVDGDAAIAGLRYFDGSSFDVASLSLDGRFPVSQHWRVEPALVTQYRMQGGASDEIRLLPRLRLEWRRWRVDLELEAGAQWIGRLSGADEWGYLAEVGVRFDF
jgi:hypothetical protein